MSLVIKLKNIYHYVMAWAGDVIYNHPSHRLTIIGITGTKGKSTVVELLAAVLEAAGHKVAFMSSVHIKVGRSIERNPTPNSMPGRFFLQRFLKRALSEGCTFAILEVTSQGIVQHRHKFIDFDAAAMTCLHPEHIESHGSFENYKNAKTSFFNYVAQHSIKPHKFFFVNAESPYGRDFALAAGAGGKIVEYSKEQFLNRYLGGDRMRIGPWFESDFNLENAALVTEIAGVLGVNWQTTEEKMKTFRGVPGRMEMIPGGSVSGRQRFSIVIDYAHTPDSLAGLYRFLRAKLENNNPSGPPRLAEPSRREAGRLICVLGSAGGGRDKWKRPEMGKIANTYCDEIILTSEDPYDEDPNVIMDEIAVGISLRPYIKIEARRNAIRRALEVAKTGDTVVMTGKGSEMWMHLEGGQKIAWNERKIVEACLMEMERA